MQPIRVGDEFRYYQFGIASYSLGCSKTHTPGVFTRVQNYIDWIKEKLQVDMPYRTKNRFNNDNYSF